MPTSRVILVLYAFTATTNVMASGTGNDSLFWATKPLLMPLLAGFLIFTLRESGQQLAGPGRLVLVALGFATLGDIALMIDGDVAFYAGMAAFAGCHACYITAFLRAGAASRLRRWPGIVVPIGYTAVVVAAEVVLRLPIPVLAYGCVLALMATSAAGLGWLTGVGAALFLVSDLMIGIGLNGPALPGPPIWVMLTYTIAQVLIVYGWTSRPAPGPAIPRPRRGELPEQVRAQ